MQLVQIREGHVHLYVPETDLPEKGEVFYNPRMAFDRNISATLAWKAPLILERPRESVRVCDPLSASGVRALRYAKESELDVTANDISKSAVALMHMNAGYNGVKMDIQQMNANALLTQRHFDVVDIDPFGSPITFVEDAASSIPFRGLLFATATDLGPLMGAYPEVCRRRYGVTSLFTEYNRELGLRILITAIMRRCFALEKTFVPLFAYARRHYYRVYGIVRYGNNNVNRTMKEFGYVSHCAKCGWREAKLALGCPLCKSKTEFCGEIFLGELQDQEFSRVLAEDLYARGFNEEATFVKSVSEEQPFPFYFDTHAMAERMKASPPTIEKVMTKLKAQGFKSSRTHFEGTAIKTNASYEDVKRALG